MNDIITYTDHLPGRTFAQVRKEMEENGFQEAGRINVHDYANHGPAHCRITMRRGSHETATRVEIEYEWSVDKYGIGRPGKIISAKVLEHKAEVVV